jgi:hypothetical protein
MSPDSWRLARKQGPRDGARGALPGTALGLGREDGGAIEATGLTRYQARLPARPGARRLAAR